MKWFRQPQVLVYLQILVILYFVLAGPVMARGFWLWIELAGLAVVIWALLSMPSGTFSVFPMPRESGTFTGRGPYRLVRHPMYTGLILVLTALTISYFSLFSLGVLVLLCVVLTVKMDIEETMLAEQYPEYRDYRATTKRIIPWIW